MGNRLDRGALTFPDGTKYVGGFKDGTQNGQGTLTFPDGTKYVVEWKNGKEWNITLYEKNGNIKRKWMNGK